MPIDTTHKDFNANAGKWERCRDVAGGTDSIKAKTIKYLPMLSGQDALEYDAYIKRAEFYGAFSRTVQGVGGAVFRRAPTVEVPEQYVDYTDDITLTGIPFNVFARNVFDEVMTVGRVGVYAEMPVDGSADLPLRPYAVMVTAENITNWRSSWSPIFGRYILDMVIIKESITESTGDPYEGNDVKQYREMLLIDGNVVVNIWRENKQATNNKGKWTVQKTIEPMRLGQPLDRLPFQFINVTDLTPNVQKPPLLDLVDANLSHYLTSADLEHGRHYCGLPTAWVAGFPRETELRVGANVAWVSDDPAAKVGMLEFTGQGLGPLENAAEHKEKRMAVLGARMLESQPRGIEAADTVRLRQAGEAATIQGVINATEFALERLMGWLVYWGGGDADDAIVELNRDVIDTTASPQELTAWTQALQSGAISYDTYYYLLQRADITRPHIDAEEEKEGINNDGGGIEQNRGTTSAADNNEIAAAVADAG